MTDTPELDDIDPDSEEMQLPDCVAYDHPWSEDDDEDTVPDTLDEDGEQG